MTTTSLALALALSLARALSLSFSRSRTLACSLSLSLSLALAFALAFALALSLSFALARSLASDTQAEKDEIIDEILMHEVDSVNKLNKTNRKKSSLDHFINFHTIATVSHTASAGAPAGDMFGRASSRESAWQRQTPETSPALPEREGAESRHKATPHQDCSREREVGEGSDGRTRTLPLDGAHSHQPSLLPVDLVFATEQQQPSRPVRL